jgi:hypothetical protein
MKDPWPDSLWYPQKFLLTIPLENMSIFDEVNFSESLLTSFSGPFSLDSIEPL